MSDLPEQRVFIQTESARFRSAVSESLLQTVGKMANFLGKRNHQEKQFFINGPYGIATVPATALDGLTFFQFDAEIIDVWAFNLVPGSSGTTEIDIKIADPGGSFTSIFSTTPKFTSASASNSWVDALGIVPPGSGVTAPVLSVTNVDAGQALRLDLFTSARWRCTKLRDRCAL